MAKLGRSTYTLTDLTETLPVSLVLKSNLDKNIQVKNGSRYEPDFENTQEGNSKGVIITPSLFLGQENLNIHENEKYVKPNNRKTGFLYYEIGSTTYKYGDSTSGIYVDIQGRLHIEQNLTENITIEAYIQNFIYESHNYEVELVQAINPINLLLLEDNDNFYAVIECEGGREHFDDKNHYPIKMMACLYKGNSPINKNGEAFDIENYKYSWDRLGDSNTIADSTKPTLTVERKDILNRDLYTCLITDENTGLTYTAQQFIYDFSDQYYCQLINNKPLLLSEANTEVKITANVWDRGEQIEDMTTEDGKKIYNLSYQWIAIDSNGQEIDLVGHKEGEDYGFTAEKTFIVKTSDNKIPKKDSFTIYCKVFNTDSSSTYPIAGNTISFQYIPVYSVRIKPKDIFVDTSNSGAYLGNENGEYTFEFQLLDKEGQIINYDDADANIKAAPTGKDYSSIDGTEINFIQAEDKKWNFTGTIKLNLEHQGSLWNIDESSKQYEFTYVYFGQQFTDEVNIIKNRSGENGEQGFSGYTIDLSNEFHAFSGGEGRADSDQETSCIVSAYFGSEKQTIKEIKINNDFIIYKQNKINGIKKKYTLPNLKGCLFIKASENALKQIEIIIRTNNSTKEPDAFLTGIESIPFYISISQDNKKDLSFLKTFTYTINYNGKSYSLVTDTNTIIYSQTNGGTYSPASFNVSATTRAENGAASTYSKGIIIYSFDSKKWKYLGSSGIISDYQNLDNIYIRLYSSLAKDYITSSNINITEASPYLLDMETIPIVTSMDGYELGGENLLRWTKDLSLSSGKWITKFNTITNSNEENFGILKYNVPLNSLDGNGQAWHYVSSLKIPFLQEYLNKDFCLSFDIKVNNFNGTFGPYLVFNSTTDKTNRERYGTIFSMKEDGTSGSLISFNKPNFTKNEWIRVSYHFNLSEDRFNRKDSNITTLLPWTDCKYMSIRFYLEKDGILQIKKPKLEIGNIVSSWSPSSYDIEYPSIAGENLFDDNNIKTILTGRETYGIETLSSGTYTLSYSDCNIENDSNSLTSLRMKIGNQTYSQVYSLPIQNSKYSLTFSIPSNGTLTIYPYKEAFSSSDEISIDQQQKVIFSYLKLEEGDTPTSWSYTPTQLDDLMNQLTVYFSTSSGNTYSGTGVNGESYNINFGQLPVIAHPTLGEIAFTSLDEFTSFINSLMTENNKAFQKYTATQLTGPLDRLSAIENAITINAKGDEESGGKPFIEISTKGLNSNNSLYLNNLRLLPDKLSFYGLENGEETELAYFSSTQLYVKKARITDYIDFGGDSDTSFLRFKVSNAGGIGVLWVQQ